MKHTEHTGDMMSDSKFVILILIACVVLISAVTIVGTTAQNYRTTTDTHLAR